MDQISNSTAASGADGDGPPTYTSVGYPNDAYYLSNGTDLNTMKLTLVDMDADGDIGPGDYVNGEMVTNSYLGDKIGVAFDSGGTHAVEGVTFYLDDGSEIFMATDGTHLEDGTATGSSWVESSTDVPVSAISAPCFVSGTRIRTPGGEVPVEALCVGDLVETLDHGPQPIRWIGKRTLPGRGALAPVCFHPDALGSHRALWVSPQHRMLLDDGRLSLMFAAPQVLAAACHLVNGDSIASEPRMQVTYIHLLLDRHEILFAEGVPTESFHPGLEGMRGFGAGTQSEFFKAFPELSSIVADYGPCARRVLRAHEAVLAGQMVIAPRAVLTLAA